MYVASQGTTIGFCVFEFSMRNVWWMILACSRNWIRLVSLSRRSHWFVAWLVFDILKDWDCCQYAHHTGQVFCEVAQSSSKNWEIQFHWMQYVSLAIEDCLWPLERKARLVKARYPCASSLANVVFLNAAMLSTCITILVTCCGAQATWTLHIS